MYVIGARNVNDAYKQGVELLLQAPAQHSRAGNVLALQEPLCVTYERPLERVLFDPVRDANPFFHFFEALWLLAGRNDAWWLDQFVHDFSSRFAEKDGHLHGSYGFRWRHHFDLDGEGNPNMPDQLDTVVRLLKTDPLDRRVVIQMWDAVSDLGQDRSDIPCNLLALPRIRYVKGEPEPYGGEPLVRPVLDLTVFNRSNDVTWGLFGANAVQFSFLLEYLAGRIGVGVGRYHQISNNAHLYESQISKCVYERKVDEDYPAIQPIGDDWGCWDDDLRVFMLWEETWPQQQLHTPNNVWFEDTAQPLYIAHVAWKEGHKQEAYGLLANAPRLSQDWRQAALAWMRRRM